MKKILLAFIFFGLISCKQHEKFKHKIQKNDTVEKLLEAANNDCVPRGSRLKITQQALKIIKELPEDSLKRAYYFKIANRYWNINEMEKFKEMIYFILKKSEKERDTLNVAKAYINIGDYYYTQQKNLDKTYEYLTKAEKIYLKVKDTANALQMLLGKANLCHNNGYWLGCEQNAFKALKLLATSTKNIDYKWQIYNLLGIVYGELEEYDLSKKYYTAALSIVNNKNFSVKTQNTATLLNNFGFMYCNKRAYSLAKEKYIEALKQPNLFNNNPDTFAMLIDNLAYAKFKSNDFSQLPEMFYNSLRIRDSLNIVSGIIINKYHLSEFYLFNKDSIQATLFLKDAYDVANENGIIRDIPSILKRLCLTDPLNASKYSSEYYRIDDSLETADRKIKNLVARIDFETNSLIQQKNRLKAESERKDRKLVTVAVLFTLVFLFIIIIYLLNRKSRELKFIRQQHDTNEEIYSLMLAQQQKLDEGRQQEKKRIAKELHDGVMGKLTSIRLNLFVLRKKQDPETILKAIDFIDEIRNVEKEIHNIAYDLGTNVFDAHADFLAIVRNIFQAIENHSDIRFTLQSGENIDWQAINGHAKMQLYRILQEALQNIVKYAKANEVTIIMQKENTSLTITIADNGIGFDKKLADKGSGLINMKERAGELGGKLKIQSGTGQGTTISIMIPIQQ